MIKINFKIPQYVRELLSLFKNNSFHAYIVGGCVRNSILNLPIYDYDICTNATPSEMISLFNNNKIRYIESGLKHGTITVIFEKNAVEITTFRIDGNYLDGRHPENVLFTNLLMEDLKRRDFTINAMVFDEENGVVDYFNGIDDIKNKIIRCVGDPYCRLKEDSLRILRALRFASILNFSIEKETKNAINSLCPLLKKISKERINMEFSKLLVGDNAVSILQNFTNVMEIFMPQIKDMIGFNQNNKHHHLDVFEHSLLALKNTPKDLVLRLAIFLHDIGKPKAYTVDEKGEGHFYKHNEISYIIAQDILKDLKYSNDIINQTLILIKYHDYQIGLTEKSVKKFLNKLGKENFNKLLIIKRADGLARKDKYIKETIKHLDSVEKIFDRVIEEDQCFSLKQLKINGQDLISLGLTGKQIGRILNELLKMIIQNKIENDRKLLVEKAKDLVKKCNYNY